MYIYNIRKTDKGQVFLSYKNSGETLVVFLERLRIENNFDSALPMTYAGRLDPMAEGEMLIFTGVYCKEKDNFLNLNKIYELTILLGFETDTLDMLGIIQKRDIKNFEQKEIEDIIKKIENIEELPYPDYSSKKVQGKSLLTFARQKIFLEKVYKKINLSDVRILVIKKENLKTLIEKSLVDIAHVAGDFRQQETINNWQEVSKQYGDIVVDTITISMRASSGSYMRSLAKWFGQELGVPALAYKIKRTKIFV